MSRELLLYTTEGCHLCKDAENLLAQVLPRHPGVDYRKVDIADDPALMDAYGIRIPVIASGERELGWPFDAGQLDAFLTAAD